MVQIRDDIELIKQEMINWRHTLHAQPETAYEEVNTADFIAEKLNSFGLAVQRGMAKTGVIGTLDKGDTSVERSLALRADMDALNMEERNQFGHRSKIPGKMHACGHDGHMAMLLGAAKVLSSSKSFHGRVHFVFQPAEENLGGGGVMVEEGLFEKFPAKAVFGMHNFPMLPLGTFAIRPGPMMAAYDVFDITITGIGGHAAMPQFTKDPIIAAAGIISQLQTLVSRNTNPLEAAVLSVTEMHGGTAYNIIPEQVVLRGTTRHFKPEIQELIESRMIDVIRGVSIATGTKAEMTYTRRYPVLVNSEAETASAAQIAASLVGQENVDANLQPIMGSEDFAFMLQQIPGAYIGIGTGSADHTAAIHQADYDFNDEVLTLGAQYWTALVETLLPA